MNLMTNSKPDILLIGNYKNPNIKLYISALQNAGANVITCDGFVYPKQHYDGLLIGGGDDISPSFYGEEVNGSINIDIDCDKFQFDVTNDFISNKKAVFGICRGLQLINVYFGGSLIQNLPNEHDHHNDQKIGVLHPVEAVDDSIIKNIYSSHFMVNSFHHQAVKKLGENLLPTSFAKNNVIESIEHNSLPVFAVQWHPERLCDNTLVNCSNGNLIFKYFVDICKK